MPEFDFEVAISFAREQREEARAIKNCLEQAGVTVFYDEDQQAALWGKDLVAHLADVYEHRARYCLMLLSRAYVERMWPGHEAKTALARAVIQKGEYILPVRFDDAQLPGLPHTIGYVSFTQHGVAGICQLLQQKLGKTRPATPTTDITCRTSTYLYLRDHRENTDAYIPVMEAEWGNAEATFVLQPDDPTDGPFLDSIRNSTHEFLIAYKNNVGIGRIQEVRHRTKAGADQWSLRVQMNERELPLPLEVSYNGMSADQIAEQRARRLLLNEQPGRNSRDPNDLLGEVLLQGSDTLVKIERSVFPSLYALYRDRPSAFVEIAWITALQQLKLSGIVAEVTSLALTLADAKLQVQFVGKRRKQYTNEPAALIKVDGNCKLQ